MTTLVPVESTILLQSRRSIYTIIIHPQINLLNRWVEGEKWLSPHSIRGDDSYLMSLLDQIVGLGCDDTLHPTCYVEALDTISDLHTARISLMGYGAPSLLHKDTDKLRAKASRPQSIDDSAFHSIEPRRKELLPKLLT